MIFTPPLLYTVVLLESEISTWCSSLCPTKDNSLGFSVDLGAGWIQGAYATNPLVSLLKENTSVQAVATSFETAGSYDLSTGAAVPPAKVAAVAQAFRSAQTAVYERQEALTPATDVPLSTLLDTVLQSANVRN